MLEKQFLTPMETAELLGIGRNKIYELLRTDDFPVLKIGRLKKVPVAALSTWVQKNSHGGEI